MRTQLFAIAAFLVLPGISTAQDPGQQAAQAAMQANQQAMQQAQQANQQAMQASQQAVQQAQQANQEAMQRAQFANQQAMQNATNSNLPYYIPVLSPSISQKSGKYSSPITVRLKTSTRGAVIYYTTDGWAPTMSSARYTGPITIDSSTRLQAMSALPNGSRSAVSFAQYDFPNQSPVTTSAAPLPTPVLDPSGKYILPCDTPIHLTFSADVNSKKLQIGDKLPLVLADDLVAGDMIFARKGTPVVAMVSESDGAHAGGVPGILSFEVHSFQAGATTVYVHGYATREGQPKPPNATALIPVVGLFTIFRHGQAATIKQGTPFTAFLSQDTLLSPLDQPNTQN